MYQVLPESLKQKQGILWDIYGIFVFAYSPDVKNGPFWGKMKGTRFCGYVLVKYG